MLHSTLLSLFCKINSHLFKMNNYIKLALENIYVINLKERRDRLERIGRHFEKNGLKFKRWDAFSPTSSKKYFDDEITAEKACALSHYSLWKCICRGESEYTLICEDDIVFHRMWKSMLKECDVNEKDGFLCLMLSHHAPTNPQKKWVQIKKNVLASCYLINKKAALLLSSIYESNTNLPADHCLYLLQENYCVYGYFPWVAIQEDTDSDVQENEHLVKMQNQKLNILGDHVLNYTTKKKVGITMYNANDFNRNCYNNGISQNAMHLYYMLEKLDYDVYIISNQEEYKDVTFKALKDGSKELLNFSYIIEIGLTINYDFARVLHKVGVKLYFYMCGGHYINDMYGDFFTKNTQERRFVLYNDYEEIWVLPHYEFSMEYLKLKFGHSRIVIAPYIWNPRYVEFSGLSDNIREKMKKIDKINVGVFEPNLTHCKNFIYPLLICNKAEKYIEKVYLMDTKKFESSQLFNQLVQKNNLKPKNKIFIENRHRFIDVMSGFCNAVVSFQQNWELNYLYLECFYLGIPLVHNSSFFSECGLYYDKFDVDTAVEHIRNIPSHDCNAYKLKCRKKLEKYSDFNVENIKFFTDRLSR